MSEEQPRRPGPDLLPVVYQELRRLARSKLSREAPGQTLSPTALVHEAYLRITGPGAPRDWAGQRHFVAAAAEAMRRILIESARRKGALKRGGGRNRRVEAEPAVVDPFADVLLLDDALEKLALKDGEAAELVKLRHFAGLTQGEAARALGMPRRTADRLWAYARAWLARELSGEG